MHYCQSCEYPTPMEPDAGFAVCPRCGRRDETASLQPLFLVTGASGSGKTTIHRALARLLTGRCVVFDSDWLIDASGALAGTTSITEIRWDGFVQAWLAVAHGVAQSGLPTVLLALLTPDRLESNTGRKWVGAIHALALDCPDDVRRRRIEARPGWRARDIDVQIHFGWWLRENVTARVDTSRCSSDEAAGVVARWVEGTLAS